MTDAERKLYRRKVAINPKTGAVVGVESLENYIARLYRVAAFEQRFAEDWWRRLARVLQIFENLDATERDLIQRGLKGLRTVAQTEESILRYRRLTGRNT